MVEQTEAVGHAVRATYMYSGMADVAALTGDAAYVNAIDRIWENVVGQKLYITGGIGATGARRGVRRRLRAAQHDRLQRDLRRRSATTTGTTACSCCTPTRRYIDVMERTLYNGLLSGVSLDGKSFFYPNPLESNGQHQRSPWFGVACCPGNITRFLPSVPGYVYAQQRRHALRQPLRRRARPRSSWTAAARSTLVQETRYPWDGAVRITRRRPTAPARFTINVRIPGWARNEPVPSDLYRFADTSTEPVDAEGQRHGRAARRSTRATRARARTGSAATSSSSSLPMPVRRVVAHDAVEADRGRVALQRGPIVYAAEWPDNPGGHVRNLVLPDDAPLTAEFRPDLLNGVAGRQGHAPSPSPTTRRARSTQTRAGRSPRSPTTPGPTAAPAR